jgi:Flp pilus assembly secretin CpaC
MHAPAYGGTLMLKLAALFATATAALQCVIAERSWKVEQHVAEIQVVSSDADARLLSLGFNKAMAIDLPTDIKEVVVADSQTVRVVVRTFRRVYIVGAAVGRTNIFFYADDGRQVVALDVSVSEILQLPRPELRDVRKWQSVGPSFSALFESALYHADRVDSNKTAKMGPI